LIFFIVGHALDSENQRMTGRNSGPSAITRAGKHDMNATWNPVICSAGLAEERYRNDIGKFTRANMVRIGIHHLVIILSLICSLICVENATQRDPKSP
jgi:hypothetical protein